MKLFHIIVSLILKKNKQIVLKMLSINSNL